MVLDLSSLAKAISQGEKALYFLGSDLAKQNPDLREQLRAAAVQAFEFTYELSIKMLRRQMERISANPDELRGMAFMDFIRSAAEAGLVRDVPPFRIYRDKRNTTSHMYDGAKAEEVVSLLEGLLADARFILAELEKRNVDTD